MARPHGPRGAAGDFSDAALLRSLFEDSAHLNALVRELGLQRYQRWLPKMLRWEFQRAFEGAERLEVTVPDGLSWSKPGKRPKQRVGLLGGFRLEHIEQHIERFYVCEVKTPRTQKRPLARELRCSPKDIRDSIARARQLLDCIDAPIPSSAPA